MADKQSKLGIEVTQITTDQLGTTQRNPFARGSSLKNIAGKSSLSPRKAQPKPKPQKPASTKVEFGLSPKARRAKQRREAEEKLREFETGTEEQKKMLTRQGDLAFYSDFHQRQREALRWEKDLLKELSRWWDSLLRTDDCNHDMRIQKDEYVS